MLMYKRPSTNKHRAKSDGCQFFQKASSSTAARDANLRRRPSYVFLHLHKTAGNNLKVALFGFAKKNHLRLYHTCRPSTGDSLFLSWWFWRSKRIRIDYDCNLAEFASFSYSQRNSYDLVVGHQYAGIHTLMPERNVLYFTFVRHPLARKVSHFQHFEVEPRVSWNDKHGSRARVLQAYLLYRNRNYMLKRLDLMGASSEVWTSLKSSAVDLFPPVRQVLLRQAEQIVEERFMFVGLQERYSESLCILGSMLNSACYSRNESDLSGVSALHGKKLNAAQIAKGHENYRGHTDRVIRDLPADVRRATELVEGGDMAIYERTVKRFAAQLAQHTECQVF